MKLTPGMRLLVLTLLYDLRVMRPEQAMAVVSRRELDALLRRGLLVARERPAKPPIALDAPLAARRAGSSDPPADFSELAWIAEARWRPLPFAPTTVLG